MRDLTLFFSGLSTQLGTPLDLSQGAVRLVLGEYGPWWLEVDPQGVMLTIHHTVSHFEAANAAHWLALNADVSRMGGAWLALHAPTNTIRLLLLLELDRFDATDLVNVMNNLLRLRADLPTPSPSDPVSAHQNHKSGDFLAV